MKTVISRRLNLSQVSETAQKLISRMIMVMALFLLALTAEARGSELQISLWNGEGFEIEIDGTRYYSDCLFELDNLAPGQNRVRVTQRRSNSYGNGGQGVKVLYNGVVNLPRQAKVVGCVRPNRMLSIVETIALRPQGNYGSGGSCGSGSLGGGYGGSNGYGYDDPYGSTYNTGGFSTPAPAMDCITNSEMNQILDAMHCAWFDSDRLRIAKQHIRHRHLASHQVRMMMEEFDFESSRLELAKFAYASVSDPHNYHLVNSAFCFNSSIRELEEFICRH
jgi:hypothetical protein